MKFVYPVTPKNGNDDKLFYLKGASNRTGYYPIGRMNTWHGGIHYEGDNAIHAISDGNIIAYRVCSDIDKDGKKRSFSNSFVLIQHQYESPNKQKLCFYSLYNHLSFFQEMIGKKIPAIFKVNAYSVKDTAKDTKEVKGAKIKDASGNLLAIAPMGTKLKFLADDKDKDRRKVEYKTPKGKSIVGETYVAKFNTVQIVDATSGEVLAESFKGNDGDNEYGANLYKEPKNSSEIKQLIVRGSSIEIAKEDRGKTGWLKVTKVGDEKVSGYCNSGALKIVDVFTLTNDQLDTVVNPCIEVKAGDIIGFTGKNGFEKQEAYRGVHVEVFTPDDVTNFLTNVNKDGDKNKNFTKLTEGTELKKKFPLQVIKNTPVKKTGKTTEAYTEIELENLEVIVNDRETELPEYNGGFYVFKESGTSKLTNTSALANFNKIVGDIAKMGDQVKLEKELEGDQRKVTYINAKKGFTFWLKNEDIEEKTLSFTIQQASVVETTSQTTNTSNVAVLAPPAPKSTVETKKYDRLNKEISEVYLIAPDEKNVNTKIVADVIVNIKEGKIYKDEDEKEWYLLEPIGVQKNGVAIHYKGLVCKDELDEIFSPYDWTKFGFEVKEDTANNYIYSLDKPTSFFSDICKIVDEDGDGILEPYELQRALSNHYTANKLSHLVCKHFNEWAYGSKYIGGLVDEYDNFFKEAVKKDAKGKALANQQELDEIKQERLDALKAKVSDLEIWEGVEIRKSSYRTKFVNGALMSSPIIMGEYLIYKLGKWVYERMAYGDKKEEEIPLSPFPIDNPEVYHFHPVAFVEQMRRMNDLTSPPWMDIALAEAKKAKYVKETLSPTSEMANKYHTYVGLPKATGSTAWCSSFVSWCLGEADQKNSKSAGSQSVLWNEGKLFKRIKEPVYGCIVLMTNYVKSTGKSNSHGHVTFLYGVDDNGDLICLGGNQGNRLKYSRYFFNKANSTFTQKGVKVEQRFNGYFLPVDYPASNSKQPEIVDIKKLNNELAGKAVKSNVKNEKTT